jgi:hypothetical protein
VGALVEKLKPEKAILAKSDIVGYIFEEETKTLQFLSQKEADELTRQGKQWKEALTL